MSNNSQNISQFFVAGINYKKTDAAVRGKYAISNDQYAAILALAPEYGVREVFVVSTCNRTEIFGFAESAAVLSQLLCTQTEGNLEEFEKMAYIRQGKEAIEHLFDVAAGLDSQILGDYEIVGQLKQSVRFAKENGFIGAYLERLNNAVLQSSKEIKTNTALSGGTISVSFAAVQYIKQHITDIAGKKILLLGTGKIGRNTCKNLVDYLGTKNITLINRTEEKAAELAAELGLHFAYTSELAEQVAIADIILVATNSLEPVILASHVEHGNEKLIIDLSIPYNVAPETDLFGHITLVNVDGLSKIKDETLHMREAEVPKAKAIIAKHVSEFMEWCDLRRYVPVLKAVKVKLGQLDNCDLYINHSSRQTTTCLSRNKEERIQKVINGMAVKMRGENQPGCTYIQAINEYITLGAN